MWRAGVLTLFPAMFPGPLGLSLAGDALARGVWRCESYDIRTHGLGRHRTVDDRPAGGGPGMVLRADVVAAALDAHAPEPDDRPRVLMSPRGRPLTQAMARGWAAGPGVVVVCGRFEGVDERIIAARNLLEVSIGDYVLSGGELAALVLLDACVRLLPGVMGAETSGHEESFESGLLEYPHYTRPRSFEGRPIPDVLLSGDHRRIALWRRGEAERLTAQRRPDLIAGRADAREIGLTTDRAPPFAREFRVEVVADDAVAVRHRISDQWWRFEVADKNGRRQLVHSAHRMELSGGVDERAVIDAFDTATWAARRRGLID